MATKLSFKKMLERVRKIGNYKTPNEAVTAARQEYANYKKRLKILDLMGTIEYDPDYDYKAARRSKRC